MSTTPGKSGFTPRTGMPAFGAFGPQQASASLLFEKSNPGLRRSTPDSEALASSDDEADHHSKASGSGNAKPTRTQRRTSWLNDVSAANANRKPSITAPYSPSTSNPGTPSADQMPWTSIASPGSAAWNNPNASYPWGNIWSQDGRKEPPSRLQEVLPATTDAGIPFTIPLQPTPKTYRSQSYSVGQLDTSTANPASIPISTSTEATRNRLGGQYPPLQRRTSRTSGLGTMDGGLLKRVQEVEDDDESGRLEDHGDDLTNSQQRVIEHLERENAQLRQIAQNRERTYTAPTAQAPSSTFRNSRIRGPVPEEGDNAVDDNEDMSASGTLLRRENGTRRLSENTGMAFDRHQQASADHRSFDSVRKAHWQTSLGFGSIPEAPQSRRHSFADVPTRQGSFSSNGRIPTDTLKAVPGTDFAEREEEINAYENAAQNPSRGNDRELALVLRQPTQVQMEQEHLINREHAAIYFNTDERTRRVAEARVQQSFITTNPYSPHAQMGGYLGPTSQPLHIVNFKCCRSDVFYVQDGTGLHVNVGDLVIVEADRGTDLGTVQHTNISWDEARRYKEHYAEEHYKWLMMFSQQSRNGGPNVINPNGLPGKQGSAVGGMGPPGHHGSHEAAHAELKPKMIKRLAQNHEILALKDKEGNEAKAKRVCQQKVVEHRLNMEILDAEFQMDSKKLTFYYFADSYINFNSLVTDLFKIYKTRIWMSAINPASFQTPTSSLGLQPAYGGHPVMGGRDSPAGRRRGYGPAPALPPFGDAYENERAFAEQGSMRSPFMGQFPGFPPGMQPAAAGIPGFGTNMPPQMDPFAQYYGQPFQMLNPNAPNFASNRPDLRSRGSNHSPVNDWTGRFQGLSLGS